MKHNNFSTNNPTRVKLALILAFLWGGLWAAYLQFTRSGRWLAARRTYITVIIGVSVDLLIGTITIPFGYVVQIFSIFAASGLLMVLRSLINELDERDERNNVLRRR